MTAPDVVAQAVAASSRSWRTLLGGFSTRSDEGLLEEGSSRFHGESSANAGVRRPSCVSESNFVFRAWNSSFCIRLEASRRERGDTSDHVVRLGTPDNWWGRRRDGKVESGGAPLRTLLGFCGLDLLLRPYLWLASAFQTSGIEDCQVEDRHAWSVQCSPTEQLPWEAGELHVLGADRYRFDIDQQTGVVLAWAATIDGAPAREARIDGLGVDLPAMAKVQPHL